MNGAIRPQRGTPTILIGTADVERRRAREAESEAGERAIQQLLKIVDRKLGL